jgi:broad specificity phosphatase PhoE
MGRFGPRADVGAAGDLRHRRGLCRAGLKYPANPPSVGDPETISIRTGLYFSMIAFSLAAMIAAWMLRNRLVRRFGPWNAALIAAGAYLVVVVVVSLALPAVNEVPEGFPADRAVAVPNRVVRRASHHVGDDRSGFWRSDRARPIGEGIGQAARRLIRQAPHERAMAMTAHLLLLCHAATASSRIGAFPDEDEKLDPRAVGKLGALAERRPYSDRQFVSPALRGRQTAAALGLDQAVVEPGLAECDFGRWRGETVQAVQEREPEAFAEWMLDPATNPHGGESIVALIARIRPWLGLRATDRGVTLAITHASIVRAAIVAAIEADVRTFWRIDIAPLSLVRLSGHAGRWNLVGLRRFAEP